MNKEIDQLYQKINYQDILNKKFYPVWFFTNERINHFFLEIENNREIKKVFSVGGGGDFSFSLLSTPVLEIDELNICDIRQMACVSIDFKIGLLKNLNFEEFVNLFLKKESFPKIQAYKRIEETITPLSKKIIEPIIKNCSKDDFWKCLKKSGLWYRDSFWQIKNRKDYLLYLISEERYNCLQKKLDRITIYAGDFNENLQRFQNSHYDLIYVSNILDSKKYCPENNLYLQTIKDKLGSNGLLFAIAQSNPKKMIKLIEQNGFSLKQKQIHKFNIISSIFGHYDYSFLLFAKE